MSAKKSDGKLEVVQTTEAIPAPADTASVAPAPESQPTVTAAQQPAEPVAEPLAEPIGDQLVKAAVEMGHMQSPEESELIRKLRELSGKSDMHKDVLKFLASRERPARNGGKVTLDRMLIDIRKEYPGVVSGDNYIGMFKDLSDIGAGKGNADSSQFTFKYSPRTIGQAALGKSDELQLNSYRAPRKSGASTGTRRKASPAKTRSTAKRSRPAPKREQSAPQVQEHAAPMARLEQQSAPNRAPVRSGPIHTRIMVNGLPVEFDANNVAELTALVKSLTG